MCKDRIKQLREENGWRQKDLAEKSGVKLVTIQKLEGGYSDIYKAQFITLYNIAKVFGVSVEYLVGVSDER